MCSIFHHESVRILPGLSALFKRCFTQNLPILNSDPANSNYSLRGSSTTTVSKIRRASKVYITSVRFFTFEEKCSFLTELSFPI